MINNEGIRVQEIKTCLLCGAKGLPLYTNMRDRLFDAPGVWKFLYCQHDGLIWLSPRPTSEDIGKIYVKYYTHDVHNRKSFLASLKDIIERILLYYGFGYDTLPNGRGFHLIGRVLRLFPPLKEIAGSSVMWLNRPAMGKILDVGCGNGSFLSVMQKLGWKVMGVEPDVWAAEVAQERLGVPVIVGTLEKAGLLENSFDAVTAHHTIEHTHDPLGFLRESYRVLKPRGKLVVTTPNIESLGRRIFVKSWRGWEPPRHLYLFSTKTIKIIAEEAGFQIENLRTSARSAWERWCNSRLIRRDGRIPGGFPQHLSWLLRLEGLIFQLFQYILLPFKGNIGEGIVLIASKARRQ